MFVQVRLLKGFAQPLVYEVPTDLQEKNLVGSVVRVPIQKRTERALVLRYLDKNTNIAFTVRTIECIEPFPNDPHYLPFIKQLANYYQTDPMHYVKRLHTFIAQNQKSKILLSEDPVTDHAKKKFDVKLTEEQQTATDFLCQKIDEGVFTPTVLHGVTGSGKTEVYVKSIEYAFNRRKTTLFMLPEVSLALQFERILRERLPDNIPIFSFHSASATTAKRLLYKQLLTGDPCLIIGVHLPILLPIMHLGLVIVDEEHESGYQEKNHPKTNSKEAAIIRANLHNVPILLGSATPSISTLYNVKQRGWHFFQLKKRFLGNFPTVINVNLLAQERRKHFWISRELQNAMKARLAAGEQTILFLNRRGHSFFVQCTGCTYIFSCNSCSVSLTLHEDGMLRCHYCGFSRLCPNVCSTCGAQEKHLLKKGIGTQKLVTIIQDIFPQARIARADMDTGTKKDSQKQTLDAFKAGNIDILIGTQTITKGYHFPKVTLVGIIRGDLNLHFPQYNASEEALQQLIQVAGRAGRQTDKSLVILQTISDHPIFEFMNEHDYLTFYQNEIEQRQEVLYPPCIRLAELEIRSTNERTVEADAQAIKIKLDALQQKLKLASYILGPAKPPVHKIKNAYSRVIYVKANRMADIHLLYAALEKKRYKSSIYFTPNPL